MTVATFDSVVEMILQSVHVVGGWVCEAKHLGHIGAWRPIVGLSVSREAFDAFFNGRSGYRAQFLAGADVGQAANSLLLGRLEPQLRAAILIDCGSDRLSSTWIQNAFLASSAKIWVDESELDFVNATFDLDIGKWKKGCDAVNAPPAAAFWAPEGTELLAIGAFIDPAGNEIVPRRKIRRRFELHDCGFT